MGVHVYVLKQVVKYDVLLHYKLTKLGVGI